MISLVEALIATTILVTVTGAVLGVLNPSMSTFDTQPEWSDVQQRLRVSVSVLQGDLAMAGVPVRPYRSGDEDPDPPGTFRRGVISVVHTPLLPAAPASRRTYYLKIDGADGMPQLMRYDGMRTDMPVADNVVKLAFQYFADGAIELMPEALTDGPWHPDDATTERVDADLLRIRRIRVTIGVQAAAAWFRGPDSRLFTNPGTASASRQIPDQELTFDVAPRNLH